MSPAADSVGSPTATTCGTPLSDGGVCTFPPHDPAEHPHGRLHIPGAPCEFCGLPTPRDDDACRRCWKPITLADFKAFCAENGWDTTVSEARRG